MKATKVTMKTAIKELMLAKQDVEEGNMLSSEFKECVDRIAKLSGISYNELMSEIAE